MASLFTPFYILLFFFFGASAQNQTLPNRTRISTRQPASLINRDTPVGPASPLPIDYIAKHLIRPARFSQAAYCTFGVFNSWNCGPACDAVPGVNVLTMGGDGGETPFYYVAHDPSVQTLVVAHEGTNPNSFNSVENSFDFFLTRINATLFPKAPDGVKVHSGYAEAHQRSAHEVMAAVTDGLRNTGVRKVLFTGHSLGGVLSTMDALMLRQHLDHRIQITATVFGVPKSGNKAFADLIERSLGSAFRFVTNKEDPVPTVPPSLFGFHHPRGELHIRENGATVACGRDDETCSSGVSLFHATLDNHYGPYFANISMDRDECPLDRASPDYLMAREGSMLLSRASVT